MPAVIPKVNAITLLSPTPSLRYPDGAARKLTGKSAIVLARLAVMPGDAVLRTHLINAAWPDGNGTPKALNDVLKKLRNELGVPIPDAERGSHNYVLDIGRREVDATSFIDGVEGLVGRIDLGQIDELLASWQGEQRLFTGYVWWEPVERHHRQLIAVVRDLTQAQREQLRNLKDFTSRHIGTEHHSRLADLAATVSHKRRLLIVEDHPNLGPTLVATLRPRYECTLVRSIQDWENLTRDGIPVFDGALVDRHLNTESDDNNGLHILEYLRDYAPVPAILMTVDPPSGFSAEVRKKYGVVDVYRKFGNGVASIQDLVAGLFPPEALGESSGS